MKINELLGMDRQCACGRRHRIHTRQVVIDSGVLGRLPPLLQEMELGKSVFLVCDENTKRAAADEVIALLKQEHFSCEVFCFPAREGQTLENNEENARKIISQLPEDTEILIAVGSGTINDLTKFAAFETKRPYAVVATAASMNGYASSIVAFLTDGVKTTFETGPPVAVIADLDILQNAPMEMTCAGLGDLISRPVCNADWRLTHEMKGEYFCSFPSELLKEDESMYWNSSEGLARNDREIFKALTRGLVLSGMAMSLAGTSSPASGAEHLISHTWDMMAQVRGEDHSLHGAQVGVASIITSKIYEILAKYNKDSFDLDLLKTNYPEWEEVVVEIEGAFGPISSAVTAEAKKKYLGWEKKQEELKKFLTEWDRIWSELRIYYRPSSEIREVLEKAGAPTTISQLGYTDEQARHAFLYARHIRNRYTILDLAADLGVVKKMIPDIFIESGVL